MVRKIKLMTDYYCYPLWETLDSQLYNINPEDLDISNDLKIEILNWAKKYDNTLNFDYPVLSWFKTHKEEVNFIKQWKELAYKLQFELWNNFIIKLKI